MINFNQSNNLDAITFNGNDINIVKCNGTSVWAKPMGTLWTRVEGSYINLTSLVQRTQSYEPSATIGVIQTGPAHAGGTPVYYGDKIIINNGYDDNYDYYIYGGGDIEITSKHQEVNLGAKLPNYLYIKAFTLYVEGYKTYLYIQYTSTSTITFDMIIRDQFNITELASLTSLTSYQSSTGTDNIIIYNGALPEGIQYTIYKDGTSLGTNSNSLYRTITADEYNSASFDPNAIFNSISSVTFQY